MTPQEALQRLQDGRVRAFRAVRMIGNARIEREAEHIFRALLAGRRPYPPRSRLSWWRRVVGWLRRLWR